MTLLSRQLVCDRLRLQRRASYHIVCASRLSLISSDDILDILNRASRGSRETLRDIPSDLRTPQEMADEINGFTPHMLLAWTRRTKNIPPHYRLNSHTVRFSASRLSAWLEERSRICNKRVA